MRLLGRSANGILKTKICDGIWRISTNDLRLGNSRQTRMVDNVWANKTTIGASV